jgi:hypothetical protein
MITVRCRCKITKCARVKNKRGFDLISDALPLGRLWYGEPDAIHNAIAYAKFYSHSHDAVIRVYDESGNVIETHKQPGDFKVWYRPVRIGGLERTIPLPKSRIIRHDSQMLGTTITSITLQNGKERFP